MTEFKIADLKKRTRLSVREKAMYWMNRSRRTDNALLQLVSERMNLPVTNPYTVRAFEQLLPDAGRLKQLAAVGKEFNLPLSDPMVLCRYWRSRALATAAVMERLRQNARKGCSYDVRKTLGCLKNRQHSR